MQGEQHLTVALCVTLELSEVETSHRLLSAVQSMQLPSCELIRGCCQPTSDLGVEKPALHESVAAPIATPNDSLLQLDSDNLPFLHHRRKPSRRVEQSAVALDVTVFQRRTRSIWAPPPIFQLLRSNESNESGRGVIGCVVLPHSAPITRSRRNGPHLVHQDRQSSFATETRAC